MASSPSSPPSSGNLSTLLRSSCKIDDSKQGLDITQTLLSFLSSDATVSTEANGKLCEFDKENRPRYLLSLAMELSNDGKPDETRRLAGIILKNLLPTHCDEDHDDDHDDDEDEDEDEDEARARVEAEARARAEAEAKRENLIQVWFDMDVSMKSQIKGLLVSTLKSVCSDGHTRHNASKTASQLISMISLVEIRRMDCPEFLLACVNMTAEVQYATLEVLECVFKELSSCGYAGSYLGPRKMIAIIDFLVKGMKRAKKRPEVRLAAIRALYEALEYCIPSPHFSFYLWLVWNEITEVSEAFLAEEPDIRHAAFKFLKWFRSENLPDHLQSYKELIFELTTNSFQLDQLTTKAKAECAVQQKFEYVQEYYNYVELNIIPNYDGLDPGLISIWEIWSPLAQMYLKTLLKHDEDWNIFKAGSACLCLLARIRKDDILPPVKTFIEENVLKSDWRSRQAVAQVYGLIVQEVRSDNFLDVVKLKFDYLLDFMKDENTHVKDTTARTLYRIFELLHSPQTGFYVFSNPRHVVSVLLESLKFPPHISQNICRSIGSIARTSSFMLCPYLSEIVKSLVEIAGRTDGDFHLRFVAYETLSEVVKCSDIEEFSHIKHLPVSISKLSQTASQIGLDDRGKQEDLQASLFGVLQALIWKTETMQGDSEDMIQYGSQLRHSIYEAYCGILQG